MIDLTKPVQTRDGRAIDIYSQERMHGAIRLRDGSWQLFMWKKDGISLMNDRSCDLVNVPEKHTREFWVIHYRKADRESPVAWNRDPTKVQGLQRTDWLSVSHHVIEFTAGDGIS